jgi:tetratricopeptide (TPR) repeat protein
MDAGLRRPAINCIVAIGALVASAMLPGGAASAQQSQAWTWCVNKEKASLDLQISGCTTVIQSGKETKKNLSIAFNNRGNGYRDKGDNDRAVADYNESIRLDPTYAYPYNGRGNAYRGKGDNDRAIVDYNESIRLDPKYASPHNGRANAWHDRGEHDRAIVDLARRSGSIPVMRSLTTGAPMRISTRRTMIAPLLQRGDQTRSEIRPPTQWPRQCVPRQGRCRHRLFGLQRGHQARSEELLRL